METQKEPQGGTDGQKSGNTKRFVFLPFILCEVGITCVWWWVMGLRGPCTWTAPEALGALFSGWAFVAMFFALRMQSEELALQREELEATREELRRTADANDKSVELARKSARAQYLMFWLERNTERYQAVQKKHETLVAYVSFVEANPSEGDESFGETLEQVKYGRQVIDEYERYQAELDNLTQALSIRLPPAHDNLVFSTTADLSVGESPVTPPTAPED